MPKTAAAKGSKGPAGQDYWFVFDSLLVALMIAETWVLPGLLLLSGAERGDLAACCPTGWLWFWHPLFWFCSEATAQNCPRAARTCYACRGLAGWVSALVGVAAIGTQGAR